MKTRKAAAPDKFIDPGLFLLRVGAGLSMLLLHGMPYLKTFEASAPGFYDFLGMGKPLTLALTIAVEVGASILLVLGWKSRLASACLTATMAFAFFYVHGADFSGEQSGEPAFVYLVCFAALTLTGPGRLSVDAR